MAKLLIIDDEPNVLYSLQTGLESEELTVVTAGTGKQGLASLKTESPDVVIVDVQLPDQSGLELLAQIKRHDQKLPVIVVTAHAATETAIEAMKRGAFEYLLKPVDLYQIREVVGRAVELRRIQSVPAVFDGPSDSEGSDRIVGQSPPMQEVYKAIGRIAPQDVTVLILGESGTGKELIARALYQHSRRSDRPFLAINCAAIPEALLESELFGHEKGAFTGADRQRVGKFEQVNGGTLFLDEIGDMTPATQAKVLRLLQEQQFERIGGRETISADVRVIAATNQNLDEMASEGKFRQDLLYRLNGVTVLLPPLREREADIPMLAEHFVRIISRKLQKNVRALSPEAMRLLRLHPWPGNVRELQNVIRYGVIQAPGEVLTAECLPPAFRGERSPAAASDSADVCHVRTLTRRLLEAGEGDIYRKVLAEVDRAVLEETLRHVGGNQVQASELLGLSRTTLRNKLERKTS
ncbi:sigma-54-dependent transcriptional regulator [Zavarzinella formosa]|uniref:sigma-54-dependent transcriptional regulator n=1 Tax=Zavarzinella formosa TaxID=360055 RepID=UPI0002EF9C61|nr:sigma-54 dependent transcriptional regulator [Zavarzinella formosa]